MTSIYGPENKKLNENFLRVLINIIKNKLNVESHYKPEELINHTSISYRGEKFSIISLNTSQRKFNAPMNYLEQWKSELNTKNGDQDLSLYCKYHGYMSSNYIRTHINSNYIDENELASEGLSISLSDTIQIIENVKYIGDYSTVSMNWLINFNYVTNGLNLNVMLKPELYLSYEPSSLTTQQSFCTSVIKAIKSDIKHVTYNCIKYSIIDYIFLYVKNVVYDCGCFHNLQYEICLDKKKFNYEFAMNKRVTVTSTPEWYIELTLGSIDSPGEIVKIILNQK